MKSTIIETIDSIIREKKGGSELLDILKNNYKLREILTRDKSENFYDNYTFLQLYNNINSMEKIFDFTKDSLLNDNQIKNRNYLVRKNIFDKIKESFLSCQWNKFI
jgi:DNA-binding MltR family transcriptional regulator